MVITEYRGDPTWLTCLDSNLSLGNPKHLYWFSIPSLTKTQDLYLTGHISAKPRPVFHTDSWLAIFFWNTRSLSKKLQIRLILSILPLLSNNFVFSNLTEWEFRDHCTSSVSWCTWKCCFYPMALPLPLKRQKQPCSFCMCAYLYTCEHMYGGQKTTLGVILLALFTLVFETGPSFSGTRNSPNRLLEQQISRSPVVRIKPTFLCEFWGAHVLTLPWALCQLSHLCDPIPLFFKTQF